LMRASPRGVTWLAGRVDDVREVSRLPGEQWG
jgi:hypothetical protein